MKLFTKIKAKHISKRIFKDISKLTRINNSDYVHIDHLPRDIIINIKFDSSHSMSNGLIQFIKDKDEWYRNNRCKIYFSFIDEWKLYWHFYKEYKRRPTRRFYQDITYFTNRYDKKMDNRIKNIYLLVNDYIQNEKGYIYSDKFENGKKFIECYSISIIKSLSGCKIRIKCYN